MAHNKGKGVEPSLSGLQFINVTPSTKEEQQHNRKVIRSAAMKTFRRNQKLEQMKFKESSFSRRVIEKKTDRESPPTDDEGELSRISSERLETGKPSRLGSPTHSVSESSSSSSDDSVIETAVSRRSLDPILHSPSQSVSRIISPVSALGAGRIDPFRRYPIHESGPHINEIMDHCEFLFPKIIDLFRLPAQPSKLLTSMTMQAVSYLWPGFRPTSSTIKIAPAWYEKATERPIVMHALLFGGAVHRDVLRNPRLSLNNPVRLFHKVRTMALLTEALENPADVSVDDVILAVLALSTNEVETMVLNSNDAPSPFNSPLGSVQWLDVYGRISFVKAHAVAMRSLIARRGGLDKVEFHGLPEVISYSDILGATQSLSKPHLPFLDRWVHEQDLTSARAPRLSYSNLASGFQSIVPCFLNQSALNVLQGMAALTTVIDEHCRGLAPISDMGLFIDSRNGLQHRLLSLPAGCEFPRGEILNIDVYEAIRYAAMVYSAAVIFPLPPSRGIFRTLASRLRSTTEEYGFGDFWRSNGKILLWILVMGGIAALDTDDRTWYVQSLATVTISMNLSRWEDAVEDLRVYLWLDSACNNGGRMLWAEVVRERFFNDGYKQDVGEQNFG